MTDIVLKEKENLTISEMVFFDDQLFNKIDKMAEIMASGASTIPKHLQNNKGDCFAIILQAMQWKMNHYAVAQKTHLVHGTLGYEAQLVNAVITASRVTKDRLHCEYFGDWDKILGRFKMVSGSNGKYPAATWNPEDEEGLGIKVWATLKGEEKPRELPLLLKQVGVRFSTLWATNPKMQIWYAANKNWARMHAPDVILGVYTDDEVLEFSKPPMKNVTPQNERPDTSQSRTDDLLNRMAPTEVVKIEEVKVQEEKEDKNKVSKSLSEMLDNSPATENAFLGVIKSRVKLSEKATIKDIDTNPKFLKFKQYLVENFDPLVKQALNFQDAEQNKK